MGKENTTERERVYVGYCHRTDKDAYLETFNSQDSKSPTPPAFHCSQKSGSIRGDDPSNTFCPYMGESGCNTQEKLFAMYAEDRQQDKRENFQQEIPDIQYREGAIVFRKNYLADVLREKGMVTLDSELGTGFAGCDLLTNLEERAEERKSLKDHLAVIAWNFGVAITGRGIKR